LESFAAAEDYKKLKPLEGGGLFFAGGGKPYFGLGSLTNFGPEQLAVFPEALAGWNALAGELTKAGISVEDVTNLLGGSISLVASGKAAFFGQTMPEISLAFTGRDGAANRLLKSLLENEKFTASVPLSPRKMQGWDMLFQVDPAILQTSLFLGVKGETLLLGILDPKEIGKQPSLSPQLAEFLEKDSFGTVFFDVPALWEHLRFAALDKNSPFAKEVNAHPHMREILEGELPIGLVKAWTPTVETSFLEFQMVDVAPEKRIFAKLLAAAKTAFGADGKKDGKGEADDDISSFPFGSEPSQPLILLMVAKGAIEEALEDEPDADLNDLREDLSDFAVILETKSGEIYVGTQVAGEEKTALREQAELFGLLGSAGLTLAPDGTPYSGQEAAWLKIDRDR
jgi:hypothetical protein